MIIVKIENAYEDGHESSRELEVPGPTCAGHEPGPYEPAGIEVYCDGTCVTLDAWWDDAVYPETGDGYGAAHPELGTCYTATVISSDVPGIPVGATFEWA